MRTGTRPPPDRGSASGGQRRFRQSRATLVRADQSLLARGKCLAAAHDIGGEYPGQASIVKAAEAMVKRIDTTGKGKKPKSGR
jgi:hypothetical protein